MADKRCVIRESGRFARKREQWLALDVETAEIVGQGPDRWAANLDAQAKGYRQETALERFQRCGNR